MAFTYRTESGNISGTSTIGVPYVAGAASDAIIAFIAAKPYTTAPTQANYTLLGSVTSGSVASAVSQGSTVTSAFQRNSSPTGASSDTFTTTGASPSMAWCVRWGPSVAIDTVTSLGLADTTETSTTVSATGTAGAAGQFAAGDVISIAVGLKDDAISHTSQSLTVPGCTVGAITWSARFGTASGNDGGMYVGHATITAGSSTASGTVTYAATSSVSGGSAASVMVVGLREVPGDSVALSGSGSLAASAPPSTVITNLVKNPSAETDTSFWTSTSGNAVTRTSAAGVQDGAWAFSQSGDGVDVPSTTSDEIPVSASTAYRVSLYLSSAASQNTRVEVDFYDASHGYVGSDAGATFATTSAVVRRDLTVTTSSGASYIKVSVVGPNSGSTIRWDSVMVTLGSTLYDYFDGDTADGSTYSYNWTGTANASTSVRTLTPTVVTNLVANPSFETDANGWAATHAITRTGTNAQSGSWAASCVSTANGQAQIFTFADIPVTAGLDYSGSAWTNASSTSVPRVSVVWRDSGHAVITSPGGASGTAAGRYAITETAPAGAVTADFRAVSTQLNGATAYCDAAVFAQASADPGYFDGDTADGGGFTYDWTGTAHGSTSTRTVSGSSDFAGSLTLSAAGSLTTSGTPRPAASLALSGSGALGLAGVPRLAGSLTASGSGALTLSGTPRFTSSLFLSGTGTLVGTTSTVAFGSLAVSGSGTLAATGVAGSTGTLSRTGSGTLAASLPVVAITAQLALTGSGALAGSATLLAASGALALTGTGALAGSGTPTVSGSLAGAPTTVTNLVTNPSFEVDKAGWTENVQTITRSSTTPSVGSWKVVSPAGLGVDVSSDYIPVTAGQVLTLSGYLGLSSNSNFETTYLGIYWYTSGNSPNGSSPFALTQSAATTSRLSAQVTPPANTAKAKVVLTNSVSGATVSSWDGIMLTLGPTLYAYFDGDTTDAPPDTYDWTGTAHASTSTRTTVGSGLSGSGTLSGTGIGRVAGTATLTGSGTLAGAASFLTLASSLTLAGAGTLSASGASFGLGAVTHVADGTLTENTSASTSLVLPYPLGVVAGDYLVMVFGGNSATVPSAQAGWTSAQRHSNTGDTLVPFIYAGVKVAAGTESGTSYTATTPNVASSGQIMAFHAVHPTTPQDLASTLLDVTTNTTSFNIATVTTTVPGTALIYAVIQNAATGSMSPPASPAAFTEAGDRTSGRAFSTGYLLWSGSGATGTMTVTSTQNIRGLAALIVLRPAPGGLITSDSVSLSGAGTLTLSGAPGFPGTPALTGSGTLTASGVSSPAQALPLTGSGTLTVLGSAPSPTGSLTLTGTGALAAVGAPAPTGALTLTGSGTLSTSAATPAIFRTLALTGSGTLSLITTPRPTQTVARTGSGTLTLTNFIPRPTQALPLTGSGTLVFTQVAQTVAGTLSLAGSGSLTSGNLGLSGTGTLTFTAAPAFTGSVSLSGSGTLATSGSQSYFASMGLDGSGTLAATGAPGPAATLTLSGDGALTPSQASATAAGALPLTGSGALTPSQAAPGASGSLVLSGSGSLSTTGVPTPAQALSLTGTGTLSSTGSAPSVLATLALSGDGTLDAVGASPTVAGDLALAGDGALAGAAAFLTVSGDVQLAGDGTLAPAASALTASGALGLSGDGSLSASGVLGGATLLVTVTSQLFDGSTPIGSPTSHVISDDSSNTYADFNVTGVTLAQVQSGNLNVRHVVTRGSTTSTTTVYVDSAQLDVQYLSSTDPGTPARSGSGFLTGSGTLAASGVSSPAYTLDLSGDGALTAEGSTPELTQALALSGDGTLTTTPVDASVSGDVALSGDGTLSGTPTANYFGSADLSGDGELAASGEFTILQTLELSGDGTLEGEVVDLVISGDVDLSGFGSLFRESVFVEIPGSVDLSGDGTLTPSAALAIEGSADLSGSGTLTATGVVGYSGSAALTGSGSLTATGVLGPHVTLGLSGSGTLSVQGVTLTAAGTLPLSGTGALSSTALAAAAGSVTLTGSGTLALFGVLPTSGTLTTSGSGTLNGSGTPRPKQSGAYSGSGTLTAAGVIHPAKALPLTGSGTLSATGVPVGGAAILFSGSGTLTAAGTALLVSTLGLSGTGTLVETGVMALLQALALSGTGTLVMTGTQPTAAGTLALAGTGTLTGTSTATFTRIYVGWGIQL